METLPQKLSVGICVSKSETTRVNIPVLLLRWPTVLSHIWNHRDPADVDGPGKCGQPHGGGSRVLLVQQQAETEELGKTRQELLQATEEGEESS